MSTDKPLANMHEDYAAFEVLRDIICYKTGRGSMMCVALASEHVKVCYSKSHVVAIGVLPFSVPQEISVLYANQVFLVALTAI
jgi:hypothetical protein